MTQKTLRDEIAMAAMQGDWAAQDESLGFFANCTETAILEARAKLYFRMADAFLAARGEQKADDSWIEWKGGECPVCAESLVEIKMRDGGTQMHRAKYFYWAEHLGNANDIIAYRVVEAV